MATQQPPFLLGHASAPAWPEAVDMALSAIGTPGPEYGLGFLYVTDHFATELDAVTDAMRKATGVPHWVGTVGFGVCATGREYFDEPALVAMLAPLPEDAFAVFSGASAGAEAKTRFGETPPLIVVHADPRAPGVPEEIDELARQTDGFLVGGLTASRGAHPQLADGIREGDVSGVMLALDRVPAATALTQGCTPIGPVHAVTAAERNVLVELDGEPALEVFKRDIGEELAQDLARVQGYIFAAIPVAGIDTGDYMVRNLTGIDPDRGLIGIGDMVETGGGILFCRRDRDSATADMHRMLRNLRKRTGGQEIRGGLYYSCCGRGPNQFGADSRELAMIAEELGAFPLAGFFANGEINRDRLYGYTGVLTLFT